LFSLLAIVTLACCGHVADARTNLPPKVDSHLCQMSQDEKFPPDNLTFDPPDDCAFLKRAERMFLWVTSPDERDSYVFRSPAFFDVWSTDSTTDPDLRELKPTNFNSTDFKRKNLDVTNAIEPGEVDRTVLVTKDCRIVYYLIQVNDVYAYFLTGYKNGIIPATEFPTGKKLQNGETDLDMIEALAWTHHNKKLEDRTALAVELKSAWVAVPGSEKMNYMANYITMKKTIPTYDNPVPCSSTSTSTTWSPNGSREELLALIGMHVVFSAKGHPEMLWATFEHVNNTPNEAYKYLDPNVGRTQPSDIADHWMFWDSDPHAPVNKARMHLNKQTGDIEQNRGQTIGPSNIIRKAPWGSAPGQGEMNTKIIYTNKQIIDPLADKDVRKNYMMIGTSWTSGGDDPSDVDKRQGSAQLANSTMETFLNDGSSTCFNCHQGREDRAGGVRSMLGCKKTGLSHLFGVLQPLFGGDSRGQCTPVNN
jgi:hypothetical protein